MCKSHWNLSFCETIERFFATFCPFYKKSRFKKIKSDFMQKLTTSTPPPSSLCIRRSFPKITWANRDKEKLQREQTSKLKRQVMWHFYWIISWVLLQLFCDMHHEAGGSWWICKLWNITELSRILIYLKSTQFIN